MSAPLIPEPPFALHESDKQSPTWIRLRKHLEDRQLRLRQQLEVDQAETQTAWLRGRLAEIGRLLDLAKDN